MKADDLPENQTDTATAPEPEKKDDPIPRAVDNRALAMEGPVEEFKRRAEIQSAIYRETRLWIKGNLKKDVDFGCPVNKKTGRPIGSGKPFLYKPGAEKVCTLLNVMPVFERDSTTWEMFDKRAGLVCFLCRLVKMVDGVTVVGEGRGCANMNEPAGKDNWTENTCVKIAEKRAQVDAVLRTADLSEIFTQDEDFQEVKPADGYTRSREQSSPANRSHATPPVQQPPQPTTVRQSTGEPDDPEVEVSEEIRPHLLELIEEMLASNSRLVPPGNLTSEKCVKLLRRYRQAGNTWEEIENKLTAGIDKIRETLRTQDEGAMDADNDPNE